MKSREKASRKHFFFTVCLMARKILNKVSEVCLNKTYERLEIIRPYIYCRPFRVTARGCLVNKLNKGIGI